MNIIDLALQFNDLEWAKKLTEQERHQEEPVNEENIVTIFDRNSIALENIVTQYAVKEKDGIRAFNINSMYDRNEADLILTETPPYNLGDVVKYYIPTKEELTYMRGMVNGYHMGYRDAYSKVNREYALLYTVGKKPENKKVKNTVKEKKNKKNQL
ncbi:MAG: hypothetical protein N3I35_07130 [Clostridia bacterium]|nr:hypothetical protein [Clostridia bacterium]